MPERVSRAGQKLADANMFFQIDFDGKIIMDLGSSTGGFTEYALAHGAAKIIAVELGTKQMKAPLRFGPRIELHEKTDLFTFEPSLKPDIIVADVSFVSLRKVLAKVAQDFLASNAVVLAMLKPQFETEDKNLNKGVVKNDKLRREIIKDFENWLRQNHWKIVAKHDNEIIGAHGNQERFYHLVKSSNYQTKS